MKSNSPLPSRAAMDSLIRECHQFHGQEIYAKIGPGIARKKPVFRVIFAIIRVVSKIRLMNMIMVTAVVLGYRELREPHKRGKIFQFGSSENNIAAFERLNQCVDPKTRSGTCINGRRIPLRARLNATLSLRRLWQVAGVLTARRHATPLVHLQSVLAAAGAVIFTVRPLDCSIQVVCVASDHSPICMALLAAARQQGKATCYLQHAPVTEHFPPLTHDLSILFDRASVEAYRKVAQKRDLPFDEEAIALLPPFAETFRIPQSGPAPYRIGICLSFLPDVHKLEELVGSLSTRGDVAAIRLRRHPRCRLDWSKLAALHKVDLRPQDEAGVDFFAGVDIALVPNSGVAIEAMHYGRPTFFVRGTDSLPDDYYGFVASGLLPVFRLDVLDAPTAFFDAAWKDRFMQYDETVATPLATLHAETRQAFMAVVSRSCVEA